MEEKTPPRRGTHVYPGKKWTIGITLFHVKLTTIAGVAGGSVQTHGVTYQNRGEYNQRTVE